MQDHPWDAMILDRVAQPTFDRVWHVFGVPSPLVTIHASIAILVFNLFELFFKWDADGGFAQILTSGERSATLAFYVFVCTFMIVLAYKEYRKWQDHHGVENGARRYPPWRGIGCIPRLFLMVGMAVDVIPSFIGHVMAGTESVGWIFDGAADVLTLVALYALAVAPPDGPRRKWLAKDTPAAAHHVGS